MINLLLCYSVLSIPYIFLVNIQWIRKNRYCCQTNALKKARFLGSFGEREKKKKERAFSRGYNYKVIRW
jgi:hypothetical protein